MNNPKKEKQPKRPPAKPQGGGEKGQGAGAGGAAGGKSKQQAAKAKSSKDDAQEDVKREQQLQAIVLADSFTLSFRPLSLDCPKVLLPLVNVPMLDYTIEFLAQNGVEEIFLFSVSHADKIEQYVKTLTLPHTLSIRCINSPNCSTAGDALREIDALNIVRSDPFILISGDVVSNMDLKKAIAYHTAKRKEDPNCIMTLTLKKIDQQRSGIRPGLHDLFVGLNTQSKQVVVYDDRVASSDVSFPLELMEDCADLTFHSDLLDCHVDI
eukprot:gene41707-50902_t